MKAVNQNTLPRGWANCELNEVADVIRGIAFPSTAKSLKRDDRSIACLRTKNVQREVEWSDLWWVPDGYAKRAEQLVRRHDILISVSNSYELVGKVALVGTPLVPATIGAFIALIRAVQHIDPRCLYYFLASPETQMRIRSVASTTVNISNVNTSNLKETELHLPPANEQVRIADVLDELFPKLETAVAALDRVQANLKRYRASVLRAAVEGRLVPTEAELARKEGRDYEPASALLIRILTERRRRWEESELARMKAAGKPPKDDRWTLKYKAPTAPDTIALPPLPEGWCWATVDQLAALVRNGYSLAPRETFGIPILRISAVRPMTLDLDDIRFLVPPADQYADFLVENGDLLFTRYNGTRSLVGVCALTKNLRATLVHPDKLIRVRTVQAGVLPAFIELAANAGISRQHIELLIRTTAGQSGVSGTDVKRMPVPLPPLAEQQRILAVTGNLFSVGDDATSSLEDSLTRCDRLRQSILKWAFEGKLVDQDPNDEPASVLLERIRAEREATAPLRKSRKTYNQEAEAAK